MVALACNWLPHNLKEVGDAIIAVLNGEENVTLAGPDFPTGGTIINKNSLSGIYATGKGSVKVRGNYKMETRGRNKLIVFYEIPYDVTTEKLLDQMSDYCEKENIEGIKEIRDESGKKGMRIVIEIDKSADEIAITNKLFKGTDLQKSYSFNQVALVDKKPTLLNLKDCINIYIEHQIDCIKRSVTFDLEKAKARLNIVEGLLIALEDIDNVITLIKKSDSAADAKSKLMEKYNLNELQAKAILDMKLSKLAKLEKVELQQEKKELVDKISNFENILKTPSIQKDMLKKSLTAFVAKYGDARRTQLEQIEMPKEEKEIESIPSENVVVITTKNGYIKKIPQKNFKISNRNTKGTKSQEDITKEIFKTNTIDNLLVFTSDAKVYKILVNDIPTGTNAAKGVGIRSLIPTMKDKEKPMLCSIIERGADNKDIFFVTKNGLIKRTSFSEYTSLKKKSGIIAIKMKDNDELRDIEIGNPKNIVLISKQGQGINIEANTIPKSSRVTIGVKGMNLSDNDEVVDMHMINDEKYIAILDIMGIGKKVELTELPEQKRGGKGVLMTTSKNDIVGSAIFNENDTLLITSSSSSICLKASDLPTYGRKANGSNLIKTSNAIAIMKM